MAIEAQLADGRILEFPDGTDPSVIQATVKRIVAQSAPEPKAAPFSLSDTALSAAQSALGATKSTIEGVTGAGSAPGEYLTNLQKKLGEKLTPERQAEIQRRSELEKKAAETGKPMEEIAAGLGGVKEAPVTTFAQAAGSSVPTVLAGAGVAALGVTLGAPVAIAAGVGIAAKYLLGAIQGAGEVKGTIYDAVKDKLMESNVPEAEARRQATAAQDYMGKNWDTIAQGLGLGAVAGGTGMETELLKKFSKPVAKQIAAREAAKTAEKGALREFGTAVGKEAGTEGLQGGQGQYAENVALTREGYLTNAMKGVYGAAARDAAMGAIGGGGVHAIAGRTPKETPAPIPKAEPGPQIPPEAPAGTQGTLFTEAEMGKKVPTPKEVPEPKSAAVQQGEQLDLGLDFQRDYADLVKERERLKTLPQTAEVKARIAELNSQVASLHESEVASIRADKAEDAEGRARFPAIANAPEPAQLSLFPDTETIRPDTSIPEPVRRLTREQEEARRRLEESDAQAAADVAQKLQERKGGQYRLPLRSVPEGKNVRRDLPIPARPDEITMQDLEDLGLPMRSAKTWLEQNVVGKTPAEIRVLVGNNPDLLLQKGTRAQILKYLTAPVPEGFVEEPNVAPITQTNKPKPVNQPRRSQPSVGVSGQPASADVVQPGAGVPTTAGAPATPDGLGLAPAGQPAGTGATPKAAQPAAIKPGEDAPFTMRRANAQESGFVSNAVAVLPLTNGAKAIFTRNGDGDIELISPSQGNKVVRAHDAREGSVRSLADFPDYVPVEMRQLMLDYQKAARADYYAKGKLKETTQQKLSDIQDQIYDTAVSLKTNAPTPAAPTPSPAAPAVPAAKPAVAAKPSTTPTTTTTTQAPTPAKPAEAVETETAEEEAARKAEADEIKRRLEEVERKLQERPAPKAAPAPAPAPKAEKPEPKELPEKLREPVGTSDYGMEEGEKEILRGPQGMLFPMSKREETEYAERKQRGEKAPEEESPTVKDDRQAELDLQPRKEIPEWAAKAAQSGRRAGEVLYATDDIALIRYASVRTGTPIYGVAHKKLGTSYITPDSADKYTNPTNTFTDAELKTLRAEQKKAMDEDAKLALQYPDGPFTGATSNIVASDSVDSRYTNYLKDLTKSLGMGDVRIFLYHSKDVAAPNAVEDLHLHGDFYTPMARANPSDEQLGAAVSFGKTGKDFMLFVKNGMTEQETLEVLSHELGHIIDKVAFRNASAATQQAVMDEYDAWLASLKGKKLADLVVSLRNRAMTEDMEARGIQDIEISKLGLQDRQYWMGFNEWFADNVSRWATTADKPLTITEKFFSKVAQMMRDLVALVTGRKFPPAKAVADFLEAMGPGSADLWLQKPSSTTGAIQPSTTTTSTKTPAFQNWFRDSKVVDENGEPLVVYHGTLSTFDTFKLSPEGALGAGIYTTPSAEFAGTYADTNNLSRPDASIHEVSGQQILPVYVSMQNPLVLNNERGDPMVAALVKLGMDRGKAETLVEKAYDEHGYVRKQVMTRAIAQGYDGIMQYKNGELSEIVAFKPNQIKSAVGNRGTYSTESPKIQDAISATYTPQDVVNSMGPLTPVDERGLKEMIVGAQKEGDPTKGVKFRVAAVDSAAAIEEKFSRTFNGAVRDNMGKLNPMGLYRQAQDYSKILLEYFQNGTLTKDKATGLYRAIGTADGAPSDVFPMIYAWGKKTGRTNEQAEQYASRVLEAKRLDEVLKINPDFPKHMNDRDRAVLVAEYNADPIFAKLNAAMDKPRLALIDKMVAVGRLSKEKAEEWKSVIGYVPFDRIDDFSEKFSMTKKTTGRSPLALTKDPELVGSFKRPVGNVFENYLNTMGWMVGQVMNNDARVQTLRGLEDLGFTSKASRVPGTEGKTAKAFINGEAMYWELPSRYDVAAFQDLNPPKMAIMRTLGAFSNILRKSVTILPPFALKQVTDDVQRAMLTSGVKNPGALLRMSLANFGKLAVAELRGIQHPIVKEFGALGLTGEYDFQQGKPAVSLLQDLGYRERAVAGSKLLGTLLHRLDGITRASDLAVRKAIYEQTLKESNGDMLLAQSRAREFINFRRRGASETVAIATATIPFFNAYVQGMDVLYRAASGKDSSSSVGRAQARQLFWSRAITVAGLSTMYALIAGDDEDYQDMDLRTRNGNWILPGGAKIPVPGELGAIFKVIPETVIEYLRRSGTPEEQTALEAIRSAAKYMAEQYIERTVPIPQAVKPLIEAWTNYSFFTGRELEGIYQKQQDPSMRATSKTSELAQAISNFSRDVIGVDAVSPIQIDNMLSGYFGSTAALATMMTDSLLNPSRIDRPLHKYALLSNYLYDPVGTRSLTEFYDEREKVGKANNTLRQLMKTDIARAEAYAEAHQPELMLESAINSTLEQLERTRAYRKYLNSPDGAAEMSKAEREADLEEIKKMEVDLTRWVREAKADIRKL